jgi:hypothetical protein
MCFSLANTKVRGGFSITGIGMGCILAWSGMMVRLENVEMKKFLISALVVFLLPCACFAGPFGLEAGMSRDEVIKKIGKDAKPGKGDRSIISATVPIQNSNFIIYEFHFDSKNRLDSIEALSKSVPTQSNGEDLLYFFQTLRYTLEDKYGKSPMVWNDDGHMKWEEIVASTGKIYAAANWFGHGENGTEMHSLHIGNIHLEAFALNETSGYVELTYIFDISTARGL